MVSPQPEIQLPKIEFVVLISNDGLEFYLDRKVAALSDTLNSLIRISPIEKRYRRTTLNDLKGDVLEVVIQYLHYKSRYINTDFENNPPPPFTIDPKLALDVLKAGIALKI